MTRKGVGRLIPWLLVLDVLLLAAYLIIQMIGTTVGGKDTAAQSVPLPPDPEVVETSAPFVLQDEPEQLLVDLTGLDRPAETALPAGEQTLDTNLISGSFALRGGPDFSLYLDTETFQLIETEGRCFFAPTDDSGTLYLEITFHPNVASQALSESILWDYGVIIQSDTPEQAKLNGQNALHLKAKTMETQLESWLLDVNDGCVSLTLCAPGGDTTAKYHSLAASMETFALENQ